MKKQSKLCLSALIFVLVGGVACSARADTLASMPAGLYRLDPRHTSVTFKISHLGFSHFTGRFNLAEGQIDFNPAHPEQSNLDVSLGITGLDTNDNELDDALMGETWFDARRYPRAVFHAIRIQPTGQESADVIGDLTLHGVTHSLTLHTTWVGAGTMPLLSTQVLGFSATGHFNRSDYGIRNLLPLIGDDVTLQIETEFDKDQTL